MTYHRRKNFKERYHLPVYLAEDTKVSALTEMYLGNAQNYDHFFFVDIKPGVGGAMIVDHQTLWGSIRYGGQLWPLYCGTGWDSP